MDTQALLKQYSTKTDEELFRLAVNREELTEEACMALDQVMQDRGLDKSERLEYVRQEEEERKQQLARESWSAVSGAGWTDRARQVW